MNNEHMSERAGDGGAMELGPYIHCASRDAEGHCITCSDEALTARVLRVDEQMGLASVTIEDVLEEIDITLLDEVAEGDLLLVHGGVAIANVPQISSGLAVGTNSIVDEASNA